MSVPTYVGTDLCRYQIMSVPTYVGTDLCQYRIISVPTYVGTDLLVGINHNWYLLFGRGVPLNIACFTPKIGLFLTRFSLLKKYFMEISNRCLASWMLFLEDYERKLDSFLRDISWEPLNKAGGSTDYCRKSDFF
jgi:hypothetical protein